MHLRRLISRDRFCLASMFIIAVATAVAVFLFVFSLSPKDALSADKKARPAEPQISPMGAIARGDVPRPYYKDFVKKPNLPFLAPHMILGLQGDDRLVHSPTAAGFQSENTIAVNGLYVVTGFNDIRGFSTTVSVSGYAYSSDGGVTWTDGGQLPLLTGTDMVYGDPDVKTWTDPINNDVYFFYSSIYFTTGGLSSLCIHVSTDGGATWSTPREITTATSASDFCDKEFMGVDPETGRIFVSWTNYGASTTMRIVYSDNQGLTWSAPTVFPISGQGSIPRPDPGSNRVYLAWRSSDAIKFVVSTNNGVTWSAIFDAATGLVNPESPYGSDRIHGFPSLDVDGATGDGYIVYASKNLAPDFSDIYFVKVFAPGTTFSAPVAINSDPGNDRAQFFPWVSVDQDSGIIDVIWYDQIRGQGASDLTDVFHTHSDDGGATWSCPAPITDKTFHAEYGNDTSQPNIGDYIQCVSQDQTTYASFAKTDEPSHSTYAPDTYVDVSDPWPEAAPISLPPASYLDVFTDFDDRGCGLDNGYIEPGEFADLTVTIWEYADCGRITNIQGTISTTTPNVCILDGHALFGDLIGIGGTSANIDPLTIYVDTTFACGDNIDLVLDIVSSKGEARIMFRIPTGAPVATTLISEDFDGVVAPALPGGWTTTNESGTVNLWETSTTYASSAPNAAYCEDIDTESLNRLKSPNINVPADCDLLEVEFEITHNLENAGAGTRMAWDGALMKVHIKPTQIELAGAFSYDFQSFYPNQLYRMSGTGANPLQDLAVWSGDVTPNFSDVRIQFSGLAGEEIQLYWEVGTDGFYGTGSGMFIDNIVVRSIAQTCTTCTRTDVVTITPSAPFRITAVVPNPFNPETTVRFTLPERMAVTSEVWSIAGERIRVIARDHYYDGGQNGLRWDGKNDHGEMVASGVYFIRLRTRVGDQVARAVLLK